MPTSRRTSAGWRSASTSARSSGVAAQSIEGGRVHTHREHPDAHSPVVPAQPIDVRRDAETQERCRREVPDVSGGVKADHVGAQKPRSTDRGTGACGTHRRTGTGCGGIADGRLGEPLADHPDQHQLVVVNPHHVSRPVCGDGRLREAAVDRFVKLVPFDSSGSWPIR